MIGLLADGGYGPFGLLEVSGGGIGLTGPVGLSYDLGGDSVGLTGGVGLAYDPGSGYSPGLNGGLGLFA
jgi:hypothetical protein